MRLFYSLALYALSPFVFAWLLFRGWRDHGWWRRWGERLGFCAGKARAGGILVHAVSVGEVNAAETLVRELLRSYPDTPLVLSCFTPTGSRRIRSLFGNSVDHVYWPLDFPGSVRRFLRQLQPRIVIVLETEIWPNLYARAEQLDIPLMLANARISDSSFSSYQRLGSLTTSALARVSRIGAQSESDRQRFVQLGAAPERTLLTGNLKYDLSLPEKLAEAGRELRQRWGAVRPVWLAASTREGEEAMVLAAFSAVLEKFPGALLVLVPRHPERFEAVARLVTTTGLKLQRHSLSASDAGTIDGSVNCYLVDAMGELLRCYAACDLAFVGGSLANTGGHNVLEAAALSKPVLVGPNTFNFAEITKRLVNGGGARRIGNQEELQQAVMELLENPDRRLAMGQAGKAVMESEQGAVKRTLSLVSELLDHSSN